MDYIRSLDLTAPAPGSAPGAGAAAQVASGPDPDEPTCFLCAATWDLGRPQSPDLPDLADRWTRRLVLHRDAHGQILLNRYPYTNGHLLVAPHEHVADLIDLTPAGRAGLIELVARAQHILHLALNPQGMNVGVNLGRCAGAGLPGHVHLHIVPRWAGDANFMDNIAGVRVIPQALEQSYAHLHSAAVTLRR
jgi:ATP adenylyltransferase